MKKVCNIFKCAECKDEPEFEYEAFLEHIRTVHKLEPVGMQVKKTLLMHIDGKDWYEFQYDCMMGDYHFQQLYRNKRDAYTSMGRGE